MRFVKSTASTMPNIRPTHHNRGVPHSSQLYRDEWDIRAKARTALLHITTDPSFRPEAKSKWKNLHFKHAHSTTKTYDRLPRLPGKTFFSQFP